MGQLYTDTHLEYVILIAFPQKQGLYESAYVLRYTWIASFLRLVPPKNVKIIPQWGHDC